MTEQSVVLEWALRPSLIAYVEALPDGRVLAEGGARRQGELFVIPGRREAMGAYEFRGTIRLEGHLGLLDVALADLRLHPDGVVTALIAGVRVELATAATVSVDEAGTVRADDIAVSADGAAVLGGVYQPGASLAPLAIRPAA